MAVKMTFIVIWSRRYTWSSLKDIRSKARKTWFVD